MDAIGALGAFINQVQALVRARRLAAAQGNALIGAAAGALERGGSRERR